MFLNNSSFVNEVKFLSTEGIEVYDAFRKEMFCCHAFLLGIMGDLPAHYENLGLATSFSTVERWCFRCNGTIYNKLEVGEERTALSMCQSLEISNLFEGELISCHSLKGNQEKRFNNFQMFVRSLPCWNWRTFHQKCVS